MADNRPKQFTSYEAACDYAKDLAFRNASTRCVGLFKPGLWLVGTVRQLSEEMGLALLVRFGTSRQLRRKQEEQDQIFTYVNNTGNVRKTAKKFNCSESNVYRIIAQHRNKS